MLLVISLLLALLPLLGIAYMVLTSPGLSADSLLTVDNLFTALILLTISGLFGLNVLLELRQRGMPIPLLGKKGAKAAASAGVAAMAPISSQPVQATGIVESVSYYESGVGKPNRCVLLLRSPSNGTRMLIFHGDLRDQFPAGRQVKITYAWDGEANDLLERKYV